MDHDVEVGRQIRKYREAAGRTAAELAQVLTVDQSAVSRMETGQRRVRASELATIADFLGISPLAMLDPESLLARLAVAPRTGEGRLAHHDSVRLLIDLAELHDALSDGGHPTASNIAEARQIEEPWWLDHANALAEWAGKRLRSGNPADGSHSEPEIANRLEALALAVEIDLGIDVMIDDLGDEGPLGLSLTDPEFPLIVINSGQTLPRALFTFAHELGHVLSGHGEIVNAHKDLRGHNDEERLANAFAAGYLMPKAAIDDTIQRRGRSAQCLAEMLLRFGVSFQALIYRMHNLQVVNAFGRDRLQKFGWEGLIHSLEGSGDEADRAMIRRLLVARASKPRRRVPTLLTSRCLHGALDGTASAAPLAGLLDISIDAASEMIDAIIDSRSDAVAVMKDDYLSPSDPREAVLAGYDLDPLAA